MRDVPGLAHWRRHRDKCAFIAISASIRRGLESQGIPAHQILDVPNGVEIPREAADVVQHRDVVYVGNFTQGEAKAFDVLLEAWSLVHAREPSARLRIFGGGDSSPWMEYARKVGCGSSVAFLGRTDRVQEELRQSGIFVLPSRWEGLSCSLLEAQAAGLPAVVSDIEGNRAVVVNGVNGLRVPVGEPNALAEALLSLHHSAALRLRMGQNARARIAEEFDMAKIAARVESAYHEVVARARSGGTGAGNG